MSHTSQLLESSSPMGASSVEAAPLEVNPSALLTSGVMPGLSDSLQLSSLSGSSSLSELIAPESLVNTNNLIVNPLILDSTTITEIFVDPGNTLATASNLGSLSGTRSRNQSVGSGDTSDFYRFSLGANSNFNLSLTGMSADADVKLLNSTGGFIASSTRGGSADESINLSGLAASDYFVEVYRYSGDTSYKLQLSNTNPSNLVMRETDLGTLSGTRTFSDSVNNSDTADVYRFNLAAASSGFNVTLTGMSADADVRLIRDANNNGIVDAGEQIAGSTVSGTGSEIIRSSLVAGNYFVQVYQFSGNTNYNLGISTGDWYSSNLQDAGIIGQARHFASDGQLSRTDWISILRDTEDGSVVDATELTNLRTLRNGTTGLTPDFVENLTNKILNGDVANTRSGIGNLFAGSSGTQMERLVGKWFLGNDRPTASGTYQSVSGSLFQNGISYQDVNQGQVGDCYYMAALATTAQQSSSTIQNMFIDNGDNTYTVRFFNNGVADYVTVDRFLPTSGGNAVYAGWGGGSNTSTTNELWVALAEKAYAQANQSGWIGQDNTNTYGGISGGWPSSSLRHITGRNAETRDVSSNFLLFSTDDIGHIINSFNQGRMVCLDTRASGVESGIVANHAYALVGYNASTDRFSLYNPWGGAGSTISLTRNQVLANFSNWDRTTS